eukprot:g107.t1
MTDLAVEPTQLQDEDEIESYASDSLITIQNEDVHNKGSSLLLLKPTEVDNEEDEETFDGRDVYSEDEDFGDSLASLEATQLQDDEEEKTIDQDDYKLDKVTEEEEEEEEEYNDIEQEDVEVVIVDQRKTEPTVEKKEKDSSINESDEITNNHDVISTSIHSTDDLSLDLALENEHRKGGRQRFPPTNTQDSDFMDEYDGVAAEDKNKHQKDINSMTTSVIPPNHKLPKTIINLSLSPVPVVTKSGGDQPQLEDSLRNTKNLSIHRTTSLEDRSFVKDRSFVHESTLINQETTPMKQEGTTPMKQEETTTPMNQRVKRAKEKSVMSEDSNVMDEKNFMISESHDGTAATQIMNEYNNHSMGGDAMTDIESSDDQGNDHSAVLKASNMKGEMKKRRQEESNQRNLNHQEQASDMITRSSDMINRSSDMITRSSGDLSLLVTHGQKPSTIENHLSSSKSLFHQGDGPERPLSSHLSSSLSSSLTFSEPSSMKLFTESENKKRSLSPCDKKPENKKPKANDGIKEGTKEGAKEGAKEETKEETKEGIEEGTNANKKIHEGAKKKIHNKKKSPPTSIQKSGGNRMYIPSSKQLVYSISKRKKKRQRKKRSSSALRHLEKDELEFANGEDSESSEDSLDYNSDDDVHDARSSEDEGSSDFQNQSDDDTDGISSDDEIEEPNDDEVHDVNNNGEKQEDFIVEEGTVDPLQSMLSPAPISAADDHESSRDREFIMTTKSVLEMTASITSPKEKEKEGQEEEVTNNRIEQEEENNDQEEIRSRDMRRSLMEVDHSAGKTSSLSFSSVERRAKEELLWLSKVQRLLRKGLRDSNLQMMIEGLTQLDEHKHSNLTTSNLSTDPLNPASMCNNKSDHNDANYSNKSAKLVTNTNSNKAELLTKQSPPLPSIQKEDNAIQNAEPKSLDVPKSSLDVNNDEPIDDMNQSHSMIAMTELSEEVCTQEFEGIRHRLSLKRKRKLSLSDDDEDTDIKGNEGHSDVVGDLKAKDSDLKAKDSDFKAKDSDFKAKDSDLKAKDSDIESIACSTIMFTGAYNSLRRSKLERDERLRSQRFLDNEGEEFSGPVLQPRRASPRKRDEMSSMMTTAISSNVNHLSTSSLILFEDQLKKSVTSHDCWILPKRIYSKQIKDILIRHSIDIEKRQQQEKMGDDKAITNNGVATTDVLSSDTTTSVLSSHTTDVMMLRRLVYLQIFYRAIISSFIGLKSLSITPLAIIENYLDNRGHQNFIIQSSSFVTGGRRLASRRSRHLVSTSVSSRKQQHKQSNFNYGGKSGRMNMSMSDSSLSLFEKEIFQWEKQYAKLVPKDLDWSDIMLARLRDGIALTNTHISGFFENEKVKRYAEESNSNPADGLASVSKWDRKLRSKVELMVRRWKVFSRPGLKTLKYYVGCTPYGGSGKFYGDHFFTNFCQKMVKFYQLLPIPALQIH